MKSYKNSSYQPTNSPSSSSDYSDPETSLSADSCPIQQPY